MKHLSYICTAVLMLTACQQGQKSPVTPAPAPAIKTADFKPSQVVVNDQTGVTKTTQEVTDEALKRLQQEAQLTTLSELPISTGYNANLYGLSGDEFKPFAFISPKIYAFSTSDGARISILENEDGTVSIPFHVAMIDGLQEKIADPSVRGMTENLPETYRVRNKEELFKEIAGLGKNKIALLPGCLKHLTIKVVDREYDVTPKDLAVSDYCDISKPFSVALRVTKKEAQYILQDALYNNLVDVRADYQTRVPYMVAKITITFDKQRIYDELEIRIKGNYKGLVAGDARLMLQNILKEQAMSVNIIGEYSTQLQMAVDKAMNIFFTPVPDVQKVELGCSPSIVCVTVNKDYRKYTESLDFFYQQTSSTLAARNFVSTTRLQPLNDRIVEIGNAASTNPNQDFQKPTLMNDRQQTIETGLTLNSGDLLEIEPTYLTLEQRQLDIPTVNHQDNNVCVKTATREICHPNMDPCVTENDPEVKYCPHLPPDCHEERYCAEMENQWLETITYAMDVPAITKVDRPVGKYSMIYEGLELKFTYTEIIDGKNVDQIAICPLKNFERIGEGQKISVRIENNPSCQIFGKNRNAPMLSMKNNIYMPISYKTGQDKKNWKGEILERAELKTYSTPVGFGGKIMIRGYRWGNQLVD